jgi:hypothetical protein
MRRVQVEDNTHKTARSGNNKRIRIAIRKRVQLLSSADRQGEPKMRRL